MKLRKFELLNIRIFMIILIVFLAAFLRFYRITQVPPSLNWDEASLGYNAYSILKTGRDEFGNFLPISLRSFEDYKPALYAYLIIPFIALFGLNTLAVRFVSALAGTLTVLIIYFLVKELFGFTSTSEVRRRRHTTSEVSLITAFLLAISPWHLQFSRGAFEANLGLFFFTLGAWQMLRFLNKKYLSLIISTLSFGLSMYSYHSFRLIVPAFVLVLFIKKFKAFIKVKKISLISFILVVLIMLPLAFSLFKPGATARLSSVSSLSPDLLKKHIDRTIQDQQKNSPFYLFHNRRIIYGLTIAKGYLDHFDPNFLFVHGDLSLRHHIENQGMFYIWQLPLLIWGMVWVLGKKFKKTWFLFLWLLTAPLASAITQATPHAIRAILMVIPLTVFSAIGLYQLIKTLKNKKALLVFSYCLIVFFVVRYLFQYHLIYPKRSAYYWQYGMKQAVEYIKENNPDNLPVIVAFNDHNYDQPHIFFLFYTQQDPDQYQQNWSQNYFERFYRSYDNYTFESIQWVDVSKKKDVFFVTSPWGMPDEHGSIVKQIYFPNGEIALKIMKL